MSISEFELFYFIFYPFVHYSCFFLPVQVLLQKFISIWVLVYYSLQLFLVLRRFTSFLQLTMSVSNIISFAKWVFVCRIPLRVIALLWLHHISIIKLFKQIVMSVASRPKFGVWSGSAVVWCPIWWAVIWLNIIPLSMHHLFRLLNYAVKPQLWLDVASFTDLLQPMNIRIPSHSHKLLPHLNLIFCGRYFAGRWHRRCQFFSWVHWFYLRFLYIVVSRARHVFIARHWFLGWQVFNFDLLNDLQFVLWPNFFAHLYLLFNLLLTSTIDSSYYMLCSINIQYRLISLVLFRVLLIISSHSIRYVQYCHFFFKGLQTVDL